LIDRLTFIDHNKMVVILVFCSDYEGVHYLLISETHTLKLNMGKLIASIFARDETKSWSRGKQLKV